MNQNIYAFLLTFLAGFSTLFGFLFLWINPKKQENMIIISLSFAAGVMISISITELFPESFMLLKSKYTAVLAILFSLIFANIGVIVSKFIDHHIESENALFKLGIVSMLAIIIHNIPEGIATFLTTEENAKLGLSLALSIALHNIPEGISIAIPIYYATKSKKNAFWYTFLASLSEPLGAIFAYLFLKSWITNIFMGNLYAFIAGIMLHIAFFKLLPEASSYKTYKKVSIFCMIGFLFMFFIKIYF